MSESMTVLNNEELKQYVCGAVYYNETDGLIPYRFTKEKMDSADDAARKIRHSTGTGIKIEFYSDTEELSFCYTAFMEFVSGIYQHYFFDVYADDKLVLHQGEKDVTCDRSGTVSVKFKSGNKKITVYLPGSCAVNITDFAISEGARLSKVTYSGKTLFLGDSITHAAYADFPSLTYANVISRKYRYETVNEAIGGDVFSKHHLMYLPEGEFDTVFIAYGTNDWMWANEGSPVRIKEFFAIFDGLYQNANKYVIPPIWRADMNEHPEFTYSLEEIRQMIKEEAQNYNIKILDVFELIPHDPKLYFDEYLHPNEMGFSYYADAVDACLGK